MWDTQVSHSCKATPKITELFYFAGCLKIVFVTTCYDVLYSRFETHCKLTFCAVVLNSDPVLHISLSRIGFLFWLTLYPYCEIGGLIGAYCLLFMMKSWGLWIFNKCYLYCATRSRDSSVGIATRYGLEGPGIESRWGRDFLHLSRPALGPKQPPAKWVPGLSRG